VQAHLRGKQGPGTYDHRDADYAENHNGIVSGGDLVSLQLVRGVRLVNQRSTGLQGKIEIADRTAEVSWSLRSAIGA
jgi:hypothetical protein